MASLTLSVPADLKQKMETFKYINWSEVARSAIVSKLEMLEKMDKLLSQSTLVKEDAVRYGREINKRIWKRHKSGK